MCLKTGIKWLAIVSILTGCATSSDLEDTRTQLQQANQHTVQRLNEVENKLSNEKLLAMFQQVSELNEKLARLQGDVDVLNYNLDMLKKRQNDLYNDVDSRLTKLETAANPSTSSVYPNSSGSVAQSNSGEADYNKALDLLRKGDFAKATDSLNAFVKQYPQSKDLPDAFYWLGIAHTGSREYNAAIDIHRRFIDHYPQHPLVPEALRNIGNAQRALDQLDQAKVTYRLLIKKYPNSEAAQKAKVILNKM